MGIKPESHEWCKCTNGHAYPCGGPCPQCESRARKKKMKKVPGKTKGTNKA